VLLALVVAVEDVWKVANGDAAAGILYGDAEPFCIGLGDAYCYLAASWRELEGIAEQIV
jgi:hypothetical protein